MTLNGAAHLRRCGALGPVRAVLAVLDVCPVGLHDSPVDVALVAQRLVIGANAAVVLGIIAELILWPDPGAHEVLAGDKGFDAERQKPLVNRCLSMSLIPRERVGPQAEFEHLRRHHGDQRLGLVGLPRR